MHETHASIERLGSRCECLHFNVLISYELYVAKQHGRFSSPLNEPTVALQIGQRDPSTEGTLRFLLASAWGAQRGAAQKELLVKDSSPCRKAPAKITGASERRRILFQRRARFGRRECRAHRRPDLSTDGQNVVRTRRGRRAPEEDRIPSLPVLIGSPGFGVVDRGKSGISTLSRSSVLFFLWYICFFYGFFKIQVNKGLSAEKHLQHCRVPHDGMAFRLIPSAFLRFVFRLSRIPARRS